jgi:D-3-phosphoglycerate dehydrogenase
MNIKILEDYPEIKIEFLDYLKKWNKLYWFNDFIESDKVDVIIIRSNIIINRKILVEYSSLKYICRVWVWMDNIDLDECNRRNIKVLNTPWANADSVADLVIWWILNITRKLNYWYEWIENRFAYMWPWITWKTVSIFWFWNIWKKVYSRLKWFWIKKFLIYDPFLTKDEIEGYDLCLKLEDKKELFKEADIISFHLPLLDSTKNFLWQKEMKVLKKDVIIVNTSRWWIINENKLIDFLIKYPNAYYFADVWEEEPADPKIELLELENVLITPHIWAMTFEAEEKMHYFEIN